MNKNKIVESYLWWASKTIFLILTHKIQFMILPWKLFFNNHLQFSPSPLFSLPPSGTVNINAEYFRAHVGLANAMAIKQLSIELKCKNAAQKCSFNASTLAHEISKWSNYNTALFSQNRNSFSFWFFIRFVCFFFVSSEMLSNTSVVGK